MIAIEHSRGHGKAMAGRKRTATIQVVDRFGTGSFLIRGQFRYKVGDADSLASALKKAEALAHEINGTSPAWFCQSCGQKNSGYAETCGRCEKARAK